MLIGLYIGKSSVTSSFAAAGSLVVLLVWVYYSAQIFLLGAEFTWVYANDHGSLARGKKDATTPAGGVPARHSSDASNLAGHPPPLQSPGEPASFRQAQPLQAPGTDDADHARLSASETAHASLRQRVIVYAGFGAAFLALRLLLKQRPRKPASFRRP